MTTWPITRPHHQWLCLVLGVVVALGAASGTAPASAQRAVEPPPLSCTAPARATPAQTEGPYYKANSPERTTLRQQGMPGTRLIVTGHVVSPECRPIARAWLDFWQADAGGEYDNAGYRLRGHQFADNRGIYYLDSVVPGLYPGRTRHIHVKVRAPNGPTVTTQLYFPGEPRNQTDRIFNPSLVLTTRDITGARVGTFTFVVPLR